MKEGKILKKETKIFIFIAIGRTGSNYLFSLLDNCLPFFNSYELFNNECIYALNKDLYEYMKYSNNNYKDICDKQLVDDVHASPELLIDFFKNKIDKSEQESFFSFKIFPEHLKFDKVKKILLRDDVKVFFLKRSPIDSYISELKARKSGKWKNHNHTNIKFNLYFNQYQEWYITREKWYKDIKNILTEYNKDVSTLYYENFTKYNDHKNLNHILSNLFKNDIDTYNLNNISIKNTMKKQDQNTKAEERVENWDEFYSIVKTKRWEKKLFPYFDD